MSILYQTNPGQSRIYLSNNINYPPHLHRQAELLLVLSGEVTASVSDKNYCLQQNDGILVFPNQLHSLHTAAASRILLVLFESDFCHCFKQLLENYFPAENNFSLSALSRHGLTGKEGLIALTEEFVRGSLLTNPSLTRCIGYLTLLLTDILPSLTLLEKEAFGVQSIEQQVLLYMDSHFTEELSLEQVARQLGISAFSLSRLFSNRFQTSFPRYLTSRRLDYAKELLLETELSVTQIALDAGFGSPRTFFREFQKNCGLTPGQFRKLPYPPTPKKAPPLP